MACRDFQWVKKKKKVDKGGNRVLCFVALFCCGVREEKRSRGVECEVLEWKEVSERKEVRSGGQWAWEEVREGGNQFVVPKKFFSQIEELRSATFFFLFFFVSAS